ncbi:MAG TPA: NCS2 family permease [Actinomycetota bacterium]|jgi:AGZA family xanthine/uracil permease-like MFS transporter|nr:NCS2 family permease [Actinomycetota bacterium]
MVPDAPGPGGLDGFFKITARGSTMRTEILAGLTTFLTMAYILFVNPAVLGFSAVPALQPLGLPFAQVLTVTALTAGVMTILMGIIGKYPFAIAAGLGLNAFVAFGLVAADGLSFPQAMGVIVAEGLLITIFVLTGVREMVLNAIPMDLKRSIGIGIGLFIALIGLANAGVVIAGPNPPILALTPKFQTWSLALFVFGLMVTSALVARKVKGALLIGIVATTIVATIVNEAKHLTVITDGSATLPHHIWAAPDFALVGNFSFSFISALGFWSALAVVIAVMLSDFFDTVGTVIGIGGEAKMLDEQGRLPGMKRVLLVDSLAAVAGGVTSASSNTTFIESASGVSDGGRTGMTSVVVGVLFLIAMFFSPIAGVVPSVATAPILVIVGYFMMTLVKDIDWSDPGIGIPALLTIAMMPFTYSITNGVGAGFVTYTVIAVLRGRWRDVHPLMYVVSAIFVWYFVHGIIG